jgi:regulator of sirC expression with transglutaminase-like and TPR domain
LQFSRNRRAGGRHDLQGIPVIVEILKARQSFQEIAALDEDALPLDRASLIMALEEYPDLDILGYLRRLDTLAARAEVLIGIDRAPINVIESINEVLFVQEGLRGNSDDYFDPRNSYLNAVLDRRLGIPISLSVIYMEVARRINFPINGVGFPGHFLIKHVVRDRDIVIDAFNLGRILTPNDCQELLDKVYSGSVTMHAGLLQSMEKRSILTRMLYNLKGVYTQKELYLKALSAIDRILMINPQTYSEIRDRGLLYMQTSLFAKALADLESYLTNSIAPEDSSYIRNHIQMLRSVVCAPN